MIKSKAKLLSFCLFILLLINQQTKSQTIVTIGNTSSTSNSEKYPFNGFYNYSWSSMLYLNSEVGSAGTISKVAFYVASSPTSYVMNSQKIYVRHTSASSYTNSGYPGTSGFTLVYDGSITYNNSGWINIVLSTPFLYDGSSNLEFLFENRDGSWASGFPYFLYTTSTGNNRIKRDYQDASFPSSCVNCTSLNNILNIQLTKQCSSDMTLTPVSSTICNGSSVSLTVSGANSYTWSPSSGLSSVNGSSVIASPSATTIYSVTGKDANNCSQTKTLSVNVNSLPNLSITVSSSSICVGSTASLSASGASSYTWIPSSSLSSSNSASVVANPSTTTIYSLSGKDANNCLNTKTTSVVVYPLPVISVSPASANFCSGGSVSIIASGATTYSWSPSSGLNSTNSASVSANPSSSSVYTVFGSSNGCNNSATVVVSVSNVNAGTAVATGTGNVCNNSLVNLSVDSKQSNAIGTGTLNTEKYPFNGYYNYSWSNVIYTQAEIGAAGSISKIAFYVDNSPLNYVMTNQIIYVRNTSASSFTNANYPGTSGFTQVFNGSITYSGSGWKEITFSSPINYNGTDNLEFLFENRDATWASGFPLFRYSTATSSRVKRDFQDASFPGACANCASFANIPNVKFTIDRTLGNFVKWQYSSDNSSYSDLPGGTQLNTSTTVNTSTFFRAQFTNGTCNAYSMPAYYITNNNYYVNDNTISGDIFTTAVGNSANDGRSPSKPKSSISEILANYTLSSCDTIFVDKGTYSDEISLNSINLPNSNGYVVIEGAGIDVSVFNAPLNKNNIILNQSNSIKIENFTFNSTQGTYNNLKIQSSSNNKVVNNKFIHNNSTNINIIGSTVSANQNEISNNQIVNSSTNGYGISVSGNIDSVEISKNIITMSNASSVAGIYVTSSVIGSNIYYPALGAINQNTINAQNYGVYLYGPDYSISSYTISNNQINIATKSQANGAAIWLGYVGNSSSDQTLIYNNKLNGGTNGIYLSSSVDYEKIYNNYISNSDIGLYVSSSSSDIGELYFNSFYNSINNLYFAFSSSGYWKIKNNIFYNTNSSSSNACIRVGNAVTFVACNYNLYYAPNGASIGRFNSVNYSNLNAWKNLDHADETAKGDENSVYGNPSYVNAGANNLDVVSSSPAAAAGTAINGITKDIYNATRLIPPFIGAQEFLFSVSISNTQTITCAAPSATLIGTTASSGVSFSWVGPTAGTPAGSSPTASLTVVSAAGIYTLTVTKSGYSPITSTVQVIADQILPNANAGQYKIISASSPSVMLNGSSSTSGVSYSWTPGGSTPTNSTTVVSSIGVYSLSVKNLTNGCLATSTVAVVNNLTATASIIDYENDTLKGKVTLNISGGISPYNIAWNGLKLPEPIIAYHLLKDSIPGLVIDSVQFKNYIDSLRQRNVFMDLEPSTYSVTIYDSANDSTILNISVGQKITTWSSLNGVNTSTSNIASKTIGNVNYFYGAGVTISQQGTYTSGNHYGILPSHIDLSMTNEISFLGPNVNDIAYVGIFNDTLVSNGDTSKLNQKTMFRFNGNGTFDIMYKGQSIYSGSFSTGDMFALRTGSIFGKITYFKNEGLIAQSDISSLGGSGARYMPEIVLENANASISGLKVKLPIVIGPPISIFPICKFISALYHLSSFVEPNPVCIGYSTHLNASLVNSFNNVVNLASNSYTWQPGGLIGKTQTIMVTAPQVYTVYVKYLGCIISKTVGVNITPIPTISYIGSPFTTSINTPVSVVLSNAYSVPGTFSATPNGLSIDVNTGAILPSSSSPGTYTVTYFGDKNASQCNASVTTIIEIKRKCSFKINTTKEVVLCPGELFNLSASGSGLVYNWVPSTGLSCINCSSPLLTVGNAITHYTVYGTKDGDTSGPCGFETITVIPSNDCIENTITGCCFSNYGAGVYVKQNTMLNVYCNLVNEIAINEQGNIEKGEFISGGVLASVNVSLDWIHNGQNNLFVDDYGWASFIGYDQNIKGNSSNHFGYLMTLGNGIKKSWKDQYLYELLFLSSNELYMMNNKLFMKKASGTVTNILQTIPNGLLNISGGPYPGWGFVSTDEDGYFSRVLSIGAGIHFYPMGSHYSTSNPSRYRPIQLTNNINFGEEVAVNFMNTFPSSVNNPDIGLFPSVANASLTATNVTSINTKYYHKINSIASGLSNHSIEIKSFYPSGDGTFQSIAEWEPNPNSSGSSNWWGSTSGSFGNTIPSNNLFYPGYVLSGSSGSQSFNSKAFTLASSGIIVGTGGFGSSGGVVINVSGPSTSGGTSANSGTVTTSTTDSDGNVSTTSTITTTSGNTTTVSVVTTQGGNTATSSTVTTTSGNSSTVTVVNTPCGTCQQTSTTSITSSTVNGNSTQTETITVVGTNSTTSTGTTVVTGGQTTNTVVTTNPDGTTSTTTSTIEISGGQTTSTISVTGSSGTGSVSTSTTTTNGSTTTNTTVTTSGGSTTTTTVSTTTNGNETTTVSSTVTPGGATSTETCVTTYGGLSSSTTCTYTTGSTTLTYTSTTTYTNVSSSGNGSASSGVGNPFSTGSGGGNSGNGNTNVNTNNGPGDYEIDITSATDCVLPGKIKFTVEQDGSILPSKVLYKPAGASSYIGQLSPDLYNIDNSISSISLVSTPIKIIRDCLNSIKIKTTNGDYVLTSGENFIVDLNQVSIPGANISAATIDILNISNSNVSTTILTNSITNISLNSLTPGNYRFILHLTFLGGATKDVKGQFIIK